MSLAGDLKGLVRESVALLGRVIERELGVEEYSRIERIRIQMVELRGLDAKQSHRRLQDLYNELKILSGNERRNIAHSSTLMLELMNSCENAYRSNELNKKIFVRPKGEVPQAIIYVLTAHPTEARSPQNIAIFHQIQNLLVEILARNTRGEDLTLDHPDERALFHLLEIAWHTSIVRNRTPKVRDEAEHIYSLLFRDETLMTLLDAKKRDCNIPFYLRSWVGGDKDGHPLVDEKVLLESLNLSRRELLEAVYIQLRQVGSTLKLFSAKKLENLLAQVERRLPALKIVKAGDTKRVWQFKKDLRALIEDYERALGSLHPSLYRLRQLCAMFPGLVVPLELRESSDVLISAKKGKKLAIERMLETLAQLSQDGDPRSYARGFIISMCESLEHIQAAATMEIQAFGAIRIPVIPLFEEAESLADSENIVREMVADESLNLAARKYWDGLVELMVGYSDSAKEAGVLASRVAIAKALPRLAQVCESAGLTPVFFHGSGGSVDRGGGSIEDQTAWWPRSALRRYKVTVQGEMAERSFATPAIAKGQIQHIVESASRGLERPAVGTHDPALEAFAARVSKKYQERITSPAFLRMVEKATPYSYLNILKIGSRPAKRSQELTVKGLRAIPWVLCWTQTRVLFPTWWGVGSAWTECSAADKQALKLSQEQQPVFTSYVKALGFTLAKIQLPVWRLYLEQSGLPIGDVEREYQAFQQEIERTRQMYFELTGQSDLLWFRPWLGESIVLRSPMIHPLNLLQILAHQENDIQLLRITVTGISSGMMTTG